MFSNEYVVFWILLSKQKDSLREKATLLKEGHFEGRRRLFSRKDTLREKGYSYPGRQSAKWSGCAGDLGTLGGRGPRICFNSRFKKRTLWGKKKSITRLLFSRKETLWEKGYSSRGKKLWGKKAILFEESIQFNAMNLFLGAKLCCFFKCPLWKCCYWGRGNVN